MAARDIVPANASLGGHTRVHSGPMDAAQTFLEGEPVHINGGTGEIAESVDDPTGGEVIGIALEPRSASTLNWRTGAAYTTGDMISYIVGDDQTLFKTDNFATDGAGTLAVPTLANAAGQECSFALASGSWFVDVGKTTNPVLRIVDVLDANGDPIAESGGTGTTVVFKFTNSQWQSVVAPA